MKMKITALILVFALPFTACIKMVVPIPPPPGGSGSTSSGGNTPYGFSMVVNGMYSTYNSYSSIDTSQNAFDYTGTGDSTCCSNFLVAWGINKNDNTPLTTGVYPASGFGLENQSDWTIYDYANWGYTSNVGFLAYPDSVVVTNITDTTITGTFWGTCTGGIQNQNYPYNTVDSVMIVTDGKFYLRRN